MAGLGLWSASLLTVGQRAWRDSSGSRRRASTVFVQDVEQSSRRGGPRPTHFNLHAQPSRGCGQLPRMTVRARIEIFPRSGGGLRPAWRGCGNCNSSARGLKMLPVVQLETPFVKAKMLEDEEMSALSLELARLTGTETCQGDIHLRHEHSRGGARVYLDDAFEFDRLQLLRLPPDFSGRLSWRTMLKHHCFLANRSESFYRSISPQQWLRTVVTTQKPGMLFIPKVNCLNDRAGLEILSNVVPRRLFLTKLEGSALTCRGHQCTGGFFPTSALLCGGSPPRQSCTRCALAEQLRIETDRNMGSVVELDKVLKFWFLAMTDVKSVKHIKGGSEGDVSLIVWRNGTFARKRFPSADVPHQNTKFNRELEVALTVSHPNIVHCFGCSTWSQSADCDLFMEVLEEDLESFLSSLKGIKPPAFSCQHSLELLLQVAEGVKHLHEKKFIHGDLKPGNILLSRLPMHSEAPFYLVKIADFGSSQRVNASGATVEAFDFKIGTPFYTAPEVYRCRKLEREIRRHPDDLQKTQDFQDVLQRIDPQKIDVYSFGVIVQDVVSGVEGTGLDDSRFSLLEPFIQRCMAQEPQNRPRFTEICSVLSSAITHWDVGHEVPL